MNPETLFLGVFGGEPYTWDECFDTDYYYFERFGNGPFGVWGDLLIATVTALN